MLLWSDTFHKRCAIKMCPKWWSTVKGKRKAVVLGIFVCLGTDVCYVVGILCKVKEVTCRSWPSFLLSVCKLISVTKAFVGFNKILYRNSSQTVLDQTWMSGIISTEKPHICSGCKRTWGAHFIFHITLFSSFVTSSWKSAQRMPYLCRGSK
jgi:hypothetical protein